jgi:tRNA threonylcarbamoyl adenosine modification protein YeaZ
MSAWLAFDAGSPFTSAAVARDGALLAESSGESRTGPSLLLQIDGCLRRAAVAASELDGIVALCGPGSFTGIRVALATALGLRAALAAPVVTLSNLAALALGCLPAADAPMGEGAPIFAMVDALRGEWFVQTFHPRGGGLAALGRPERLAASAIVAPPGAVLALHPDQTPPAALAAWSRRQVAALATPVACAASAERLAGLLSVELDALYLRGFTPREARP